MQSKSIIYAAILWTLLFALMSFYWAAGGMVGVRSLGGEIYRRALAQDPEFVPIVWATGFVKLGGVALLWMLLKGIGTPNFRKWLMWIIALAGIFMILYGLLNFITISLAAMHVLDFDLDAYATTWRLIFWEPFWILGGVLYVWSVRQPK